MKTERLNVRPADPDDAGRWNAFVDDAPDGNFYQRYEWEGINREALGHKTHFLMAEGEDGQVLGVLPLVEIRSAMFGHILVSMPFMNFGGIAARDDEAEATLLARACQLTEEVGADYLEIRADRPMGGLLTRTHKVSMTVPLDPDSDVVWRAFKSKHRNNIKSVMKEELEVRSGGIDLLDPFYSLMSRSWRGLGTPLYAKSYFADVLEAFGDQVRIFVAFQGSTPVAGALNGHHRGAAEGIWAAMDPQYRRLQPNYVLYWEMIRDACERGFTHFHLGRSTANSPAARWKERWTAVPSQLHWCYHLAARDTLPELNPENPRFALAISLWRRLPLAVTRWVGPRVARLLP